MSWVAMRAIGSSRSSRGGPGVAPRLYTEMTLLRNSLLTAMREEAPVNKSPNAKNRGALRASLRAGPLETDGTHWRVSFTAADYIKYVIHDTKPHRIEPKQPGGVLAFQWSGAGGSSSSMPSLSFRDTAGLLRTIRGNVGAMVTGQGAVNTGSGRLGIRGGSSIFEAPRAHSELRGGTIFLTFVNHPGTTANDFVSRAVARTMQAGTPGFTKRIQQAINDEILQLITEVAS